MSRQLGRAISSGRPRAIAVPGPSKQPFATSGPLPPPPAGVAFATSGPPPLLPHHVPFGPAAVAHPKKVPPQHVRPNAPPMPVGVGVPTLCKPASCAAKNCACSAVSAGASVSEALAGVRDAIADALGK